MSKIYIAEKSNFINRCIQKEIDEDKAELKKIGLKHLKPHFFIMYEKSDLEDSTGETYYKLGLYKSLGSFTIRGEEDLKEVLKFLKGKQKSKSVGVQIMNCDEINEMMKGVK